MKAKCIFEMSKEELAILEEIINLGTCIGFIDCEDCPIGSDRKFYCDRKSVSYYIKNAKIIEE